MKPLFRETQNKKFIEVIGHYDNPILCAKLTLLADLYAVEHREGYALFKTEDYDKLSKIDDKLEFSVAASIGNPYLTFSSSSSFTLKVVDNKKYWNGTLEYSTDTTTWNVWNGTTTISSSQSGDTKYLYLRGTNNTYITGSSAYSTTTGVWVLTGSNISCDGNIENLLDYQTVALGNHPTMASFCYQYMFSGCTSLISAPELPATTLTYDCYASMFDGCTSLIEAPELPATTLIQGCYGYMFDGCTSLTTLPELPATKLTTECYIGMFRGCTNIKLSATQIGNYTKSYRIPISGTGTTDASDALFNMFGDTGGTFTGTPTINTTYYLYAEPEPESTGSGNFFIGGASISKMFIGNNEISKIFLGNLEIYSSESEPTPEPEPEPEPTGYDVSITFSNCSGYSRPYLIFNAGGYDGDDNTYKFSSNNQIGSLASANGTTNVSTTTDKVYIVAGGTGVFIAAGTITYSSGIIQDSMNANITGYRVLIDNQYYANDRTLLVECSVSADGSITINNFDWDD